MMIKVTDSCESGSFTTEQLRLFNDLLRNANTRGLNYSEKGFRQKLIDILYKSGYYKVNKSIFLNE